MAGELIAGAVAGLTKPATVLIEKVSDAVGGVAKPWQIQRVAKAEAERALTIAQLEIDVTDLHRRAALRWVQEETKNQVNIESIRDQASPHLNKDAELGKIEDDFLRNFFEKCRIVSDEQMQDIWARILAGEANNPGAFSRKTINVLSDMEKSDAELFAAMCSHSWQFPKGLHLFVSPREKFFKERGMHLASLFHLESIGLLITDSSGFRFDLEQSTVRVAYFERSLEMTLAPSAMGYLRSGEVMLTAAGKELASICEISPIEGFFEFMCDKWREDPDIESVRMLG